MLPMLRQKPRILLLDDDLSMQKLVSALLRKQGFTIDAVATGMQAIEMIARVHYAALLLDVMTPTEGATTVIRHLESRDPAMISRILLVTAAPDSILRTMPAGIARLRKPFTPEDLVTAVRGVAAR